MRKLITGILVANLCSLALLTCVTSQNPAQAQSRGNATPVQWWSRDELKGNDYMLRFHVPSNARWRIVGSNNTYQKVVDTALSRGGLEKQFITVDGYRVIEFSTGARARWWNRYFGSLDNYRRNIRVYWW